MKSLLYKQYSKGCENRVKHTSAEDHITADDSSKCSVYVSFSMSGKMHTDRQMLKMKCYLQFFHTTTSFSQDGPQETFKVIVVYIQVRNIRFFVLQMIQKTFRSANKLLVRKRRKKPFIIARLRFMTLKKTNSLKIAHHISQALTKPSQMSFKRQVN